MRSGPAWFGGAALGCGAAYLVRAPTKAELRGAEGLAEERGGAEIGPDGVPLGHGDSTRESEWP